MTTSGPAVAKSPTVLLGLVKFSDVLVIVATAVIAYWSRHGMVDLPGRYWLATLICALIAFQIFHAVGLYNFPILDKLTAQFAKLTTAWFIVGLSLIALIFFTKTAEEFSRVWAATWLSVAYFGFIILRIFVKLRLRLWRREGKLIRNVAIIGAGDYARRLLTHLGQRSGEMQLNIIGLFDDRKSRIPVDEIDGYPILGTTDDLIDYCREQQVDLVIVALPWSAETRLVNIMNKVRQVPVDLQLAPERVGFHLFDRQFTSLAGLPMLTVFERPLSGWNFILKGVEDRVLAALILLLVSPLLLLIAIAIKLDSKGPVLFRQQRFGFNNNVITVWKFRTMYRQSDWPKGDGGEVRQATRDDPRITRIGGFLRSTSLDELPQFFNVLQGAMSIVGPRPHAVSHNVQFAEAVGQYYARHRVKPGITGWAQVNGYRGETDTQEKLEKRVQYDLYYIDNWSLLFDLRIIFLTVFVGFVHEHAY
ncbi:MAG: undecaprenyl-phosphate glucose phosphotransferase [Alphaproteobacteria bacterium]|nr:undecaprenyl-phosphate glucose phosphotransferase [Alphaproteobacteria bacterium]